MGPQKIKGRYEIKAVLGQGGMGLVYRAYDAVIRRDVALKTLRDLPNRAALDLFYKECDVLASMSHPNIVEIFDLGEFDDEGTSKPYFVMPLLPGMPLDKLIREGSHRLTIERSAEIITQACRGLQAAHERGLVHRDLKPSNLFVMDDDSVKIIDFGVAHMVDARSTVGQKGTLLYMAPEQVEMKPPSPLSDIFSLGVVCYETMTRRQPFERSSANEVALAVLHQIPPPVSEITPAANQSISRVVHKAMAKQPWHRFATAREFSDALQKALRNEPIEFFDPARIQPRVQRVTKAFEQSDYQFADEILSELEAEGHVDTSMSMLRRQIDQARRQKTMAQLLDNARTRIEEEEYPLALQKIQEVLQLDPDNAMALTLKKNIENKRSQQKIDDWFRLAHQHLDQNAFSHARQALQNVLEIKPRETRALKLLSDVDRREQDYVQIRKEKENLYENALAAWHDGEVSAALSKLEKLVDLDRKAPDTSTPERAVSFQNFYNQVRTEHDAIKNAYAEARKDLVDGEFTKALAICTEFLVKHPGHALFQALKYDVEERQRQEVSARIAEVDRRVEAEPDVEKRVNILSEVRDQHPDEPHFERSLRLMSDKRDLVNSIVGKARTLEERGQFNEALGQWEILKTIYTQYPGLVFEIERVVKRRDQQTRSEGRVRWVEQIDRQLASGDFTRARELSQNARAEFPEDSELLELEKAAKQGMDRAADANRLLAQGQELCGQNRFDEGMETLRKAFNLDERNPVIRGVLVDTLLEQARGVLETDQWETADPLIQQSLDLDPGHAQARSLRTLWMDRRREEFVNHCVSQARQLQTSGNLESALKEVQQAMETYPRESRLIQLHSTLTKAHSEAQRLSGAREATTAMKQQSERPTEAVAPERVMYAGAAPESSRAFQSPPLPEGFNPGSVTATVSMPLGNALATPPPAPTSVPPSAGGAAPPSTPPPTIPPSSTTPSSATPSPKPHLADTVTPARPPEIIAPPPEKIAPPPAPPKQVTQATATAPPRKPPLLWIGIAAAVVVIAAIGYMMKRPPAPPPVTAVAVEIHTSPEGANIRVNDQARGTSNLKLDLAPGTYQVEASKDGYQPAVASVTAAAGGPASVDLTLQPLAQSARVLTDLETGKVALDDQPPGELQEGQFALDNVAAGQHTLKISSTHGQATLAFDVKPGAAPVLGTVTAKEVIAVVVSTFGNHARVLSSFGPVKVSLDGQPAGETGPEGLELNNVAPGSHELALGEGKDRRTVVLTVGAAPSVTAFLQSDRNVGTLLIVAGEDGAKVLLNGKEQHRVTRRGQLRISNLDVKDYSIRVVKEGFQDEAEQHAVIQKGQEAKVEFKLRPVPQVATLALHGGLPGAQVFLDQTLLGTVDAEGNFSGANINPGDHAVELRKDQFKTKRIQKHFNAGEAVQLARNEVGLERSTGTVRLNVTPPEAKITLTRAGEAQGRAVSETTLTLPEGTYILMGRAANYADRSVTVQIGAGETKNVDVLLTHAKGNEGGSATNGGGMSEWDQPAAWTRDGNWFLRKGGNFVLYKPTPGGGSFVFTGKLRKGKRLQWVVNYKDEQNYALFQVDKKFFYRSQMLEGKLSQAVKVPHGMDKQDYYTLSVEVKPGSIVNKVNDGEKWMTLDTWGQTGLDLAAGKFGLLIPGSDQVAISNFKYTP